MVGLADDEGVNQIRGLNSYSCNRFRVAVTCRWPGCPDEKNSTEQNHAEASPASMDEELDKRKQCALVVVSLSAAILITCFSIAFALAAGAPRLADSHKPGFGPSASRLHCAELISLTHGGGRGKYVV